MKKLGFTLAEIIIALTIIGVIAAITAPLIGNLIPDNNKVKVLKYYKAISDINQQLINDPSLYRNGDGDKNKDDDDDEGKACVGYNCINKPTNPKYQSDNYVGDKKFGALFLEHMMDSVSSDFDKSIGNPTYFNLFDGSTWAISWKQDSGNIEIMIDINGDANSPNCLYEWGCKSIDRYNFMIDCKTAKVSGNDPITAAYLRNPYKLNDKKADYEAAKADKTVYKYREDAMH